MTIAGARWPGYAAAAWGILFAVPSFLWALGNDFGASTTVSPSLIKLAQDRVTWFIAVLWATVVLKLIAAGIGFGLTRRWNPVGERILICCGSGAAVLLTWHGVLFIVQGVLVESGATAIEPTLRAISRWYLYLWGPWFVLGGLFFGAAAWAHTQASSERRGVQISALIGVVGGLGLSATALIAGIG